MNESVTALNGRIEVLRGDITTQEVDAIVNAANETLLGGGGVDGAIHRAAGPDLLTACRALGGCSTGHAKITEAYRLPARYVIHTVGPVWHGGQTGDEALLGSCYRASLSLARECGCRTIAFPAISCGAYGYPVALAARVSVDAVAEDLRQNDQPVRVWWVMFERRAYDAWACVLTRLG